MTGKNTLANDRKTGRNLRDDLRLREEDARWVKEQNGVIIYAVDNDIIKLYSDTRSVSDSHGYTRIFSNDSPENIVGLGHILTNYIFFQLGLDSKEAGARFLIPPLDYEFASIFNGVFKRAATEIDRAKVQAKSLKSFFKNNSLTDEEIAEFITDNAADILKMLVSNNSTNTELLRLSKLVNSGSLKSLAEVSESEVGLPNEFKKALSEKKSLSEMVWSNSLKEDWLIRISRFVHKKKALEDDASALTRLQLINSRLVGTKIRLIMITGAPSLLHAARSVVIEDQQRSFSDLWLRHPRCFLGDTAILGKVNGFVTPEGNNLLALLNAFLAEKLTENSLQVQAQLPGESQNSVEVFDRYEKELSDFHREWNQFSTSLCVKNASIIRDSNPGPEEIGDLISKIRIADGDIEALLMESWTSAFLAASQAGFLYTWNLNREPRRSTPRLYFESFAKASEFVKDVLHQMQMSPGSEILKFGERISEVRADSSRNYTTFLVFGLLFAAQDHWHVAYSLAEMALSRAFEDPNELLHSVKEDQQRIITGREALYLRAVAGRHAAQTTHDLIKAHQAILLATKVLALERELHGENHLKGDTRFEYELCSINVAALMFERFMNDRPAFECSPYSEIRTKLLDILDKGDKSFSAEQTSDLERNRDRSRVLTSLFIVEITLARRVGDIFPERLRAQLLEFMFIIEGNRVLSPTMLTKVIFSVVNWWGELDFEKKAAKKNAAITTIRESIKNLKEVAGSPYESGRHEYLLKFVSNGLA